MKNLFLSTDDVQQIYTDYSNHLSDTIQELGAEIDVEKEFDEFGNIIGVRLNLIAGSGNIITGYQQTHGMYGGEFHSPLHMQDGEGGVEYVCQASDIPQLTAAL